MSRSTNYSKEEINVIVTYMEEYPHLVSGELNKNCLSAAEMSKEWDNLASMVNACGMGLERTGQQIKNKWTDLKYRTKKKATGLKNHLSQTGGGQRSKDQLIDIENRILGLIGETCVSGIESIAFDSSATIIPTISDELNSQRNQFYELQKKTDVEVDTEPVIISECLAASPSLINIENNNAASNTETPSSWRIQNKRTINSTERVHNVRKRKRQSLLEREENENEIIKTQKEMNENIKKLVFSCICTNVYLESMEKHMRILTDICTNVAKK